MRARRRLGSNRAVRGAPRRERLRSSLPAAMSAALVVSALVAGCGWAGRMARGYAEGQPPQLIEILSRDPDTHGDSVASGMARFVFDDMGSLDTDGLERTTLPWKVTAAALVLRAHELRGLPVAQATLDAVLSEMGFIFPSAIANWEGRAPSFDGPLGLLRTDLTRRFPRVRLEAANIGCAACHAGVLYDGEGLPTDRVWLGTPNTSIDLERYVTAVFEAFRDFQGREERLWEVIGVLFPDMADQERRTIRRHVLPRIQSALRGERGSPPEAALPFSNGSPGLTNGVGAAKNLLGLLGNDAREVEVGFTSIPDVTGRALRTSLLYDGAYTVPDPGMFGEMDREAVTAETLDEMADIVTFFAVPAFGIPPERVRRAYPRVRQVVAFLDGLRPPPFPGPVDSGLALEGEAVYRVACAACHGEFSPVVGGEVPLRLERFPNRLVPRERIGTDPHRERLVDDAFSDRVAESAYGRYVSVESTGGYVAPPLAGLWATAPYLHNGSVPTLWHLMHPEERPERFLVGGHRLDFQRVGIAGEVDGDGLFVFPPDYEPWSMPAVYDTRLPGRSRAGHEEAFRALPTLERRALLEYLKLL